MLKCCSRLNANLTTMRKENLLIERRPIHKFVAQKELHHKILDTAVETEITAANLVIRRRITEQSSLRKGYAL